jgi:integrase
MSTHSNRRRAGGKPVRPGKPRPDFPLYAHKVGSWAKKVKGHTVYFTKWAEDPKGIAALEQWLEQKDDLLAGREPRATVDPNALRIGDLCNQFLAEKEAKRDNAELNPRTFWGYHATCAGIVDAFGRDRAVTDLVPDDFRKLRVRLAKTRKAVALGNEIMRVRSVFKFAFDEGLILAPVKFGQAFGKPKPEVVDRQRNEHRAEHGIRMFEANELRALLAAAGQPLRAMILLAANCAFGQSDLANLPVSVVNLKSGWVDFARVKTSVPRRIPLWPETIAAIREWLPERPRAKDPADAGLMFLTCRGARWVKLSKGGKKRKDGKLTQPGAPSDALGQEFGKVVDKLGLKRSRRSFYALRHGFETVAGETADQIVVDVIMGHKIKGMAGNYIERIDDGRLRRVVEHVRQWLFAEPAGNTPGPGENPQISDPCGPCGPNLQNPGENGMQAGSQAGRKPSGPLGFATPKNTLEIGAGSHGAQGPQDGGTYLRLFAG